MSVLRYLSDLLVIYPTGANVVLRSFVDIAANGGSEPKLTNFGSVVILARPNDKELAMHFPF